MVELMIYSLKVSVCMILLYGLYVLALRKETHFRFNRVYLLFSIIISLIIPILDVSFYSGHPGTRFTGILQTVQIDPERFFMAKGSISSAYFLTLIYLTGFILLLASFMIRFISLLLLRQQCIIKKKNGLNIAMCKKGIAPFSFFQTIFIDEKTTDDTQLDKVIMHETIHIRQLHSLDIIFAEMICLLTWFNPVSWMIKAALKETHEYLADSGVSEQTPVSDEYFMLLIRNAIGVQPGLANNFNKSLTLKRLNMMKKPRSGRLSLLKALPVLPVVVLLLLVFSCSKNTDDLKSQNASMAQTNKKSTITADKMPEFPGGQPALSKFIMDNVKYPEAAKNIGIEGTVYVGFIVTKTGKTDKIILRSNKVNVLLAAEAIRVVSIMPDWVPGKYKGVPVDVELTLPFKFKLAEK